MPDVARHAGEENVSVAALEHLRNRQLGDAVALPKIFAEKERVDPGRIAANDDVLIIVRENLRLDEIARAEQLRQRACLPHRAKRSLAKTRMFVDVCPLQFF